MRKYFLILLILIINCVTSKVSAVNNWTKTDYDVLSTFSNQYFINNNIRYSHFDEFFEDYQGRIWGCGLAGEIALWDGTEFIEMANVSGRTYGLYQYDERKMLIGTDLGISLFNTFDYTLEPIHTDANKVKGLFESNNYIYSINETCIQRSSKDNLYFEDILHWNNVRVTDAAIIPSGKILILTYYNGVFSYDPITNQLEDLEIKGVNPSEEIQLKLEAYNDTIWVGTDKNAYFAPIQKGAELIPINDFSGITVKCIDHDSEGSLLVGTDNGLFVKPSGSDSWIHFSHDKNSKLSLLNDCVWGFFEDSRNNYWVGVETGVSFYSADLEYSSVDWSFGSSHIGNRISCTLLDSKNRIWVGGTNGLSMYDIAAKKTILFDKTGKNSCIDKRIWKIFEDKSGLIWICTDESVAFYDERKETFISKTVIDSTTGKTSKWAYDIVDLGDGYFWIASGSAGFLKVNRMKMLEQKNVVEAEIAINSGDSQHRIGVDIGIKLYLSDNTLWGINPDGIYNISELVSKGDDQITHDPYFAFKGGLHVVCDHLSNVWVLTKSSLMQIRAVSGEMVVYENEKIGIPGTLIDIANIGNKLLVLSSEILALYDYQTHNVVPLLEQHNSTYRSIDIDEKNNLIFLGGIDHFLIVDQEKLIENLKSYTRPSYIAKYELNNNNLSVSFSNGRIGGDITPYTGYYYRLTGDVMGWKPVNKGMNINYNMLLPGDYALQLGKRIGNQDTMEIVDEIQFDVPLPWYKSIWFYFLLIVVAIFFALGYIRQYSLRLHLKLAEADNELLLKQYNAIKSEAINALMEKTKEANRFSSAKQALLEKANNRWLEDLKKQVEGHLTDMDFNVSSLAEICGLNEKTLYRKIKTLTGKTTIEYIKTTRMERAATLLLSPNLSINEVMYMVGFVSSSYFSRCFEETYHMKPSEYRMKYMKVEE